jgi:hypothetical protein
MFVVSVDNVTRWCKFVKFLFQFYFVTLYFAVANGRIVEVKVVIEFNHAQTIVYHVDCSDVFGGKAC